MHHYADLISDWHEADRLARFAELDLNRTYDDYYAKKGPPPTYEQREATKQMRAHANELFRRATNSLNRSPA